MRCVMRLPGLCALLLLIVGCSQLHTEVRSSYRWAEVSAVGLEAPAEDPWQLAPVLRTELEAMGYAVAAPGGAGEELLVRFSTQDGPDFTSDGVLVTRPKSLHVKLVDPRSQALVGVADYFLRSSEEPADGLRAALTGLQEAMRSATRSGQARPAAAPAAAQPAPAVAPAQPQAVAPPPPPAVAPVAQPAVPTAPPPPTAVQPTAPVSPPIVPAVQPTAPAPPPAAPAPAPPALPAAVAPAAQSPSEVQAPVQEVIKEEPAIRSQEQSPWVPRFKSWGFEEWGKSDDFDQ